MRFRTFLGGIAFATSLSWFLGMSASKHIEAKHTEVHMIPCILCGDSTRARYSDLNDEGEWQVKLVPLCPLCAAEYEDQDVDPRWASVPDSLLIDGMPECEAR